MPTVEQLRQGVQNARAAGDNEAADFLRAEIDRQVNPLPDATEGMSMPAKIGASLTGGVGNFVSGVKQLVGAGPSGDEVEWTRKAQQKLADSTDMGLIDSEYAPSLGTMARVAGEVAPTVALPGGAGAASTKWMGRQLPRTLAAMTKTPLRAAATAGALQGGTQMLDDDQSRLGHTVLGAGLGAAVPGGAQLLKKTLRELRPTTRAQDLLYKDVLDSGKTVDDVAANMAGNTNTLGIRETSAEAGQIPLWQRRADESASRSGVRGQWAGAESEQQTAKAAAARAALDRAGDAKTLAAERSAAVDFPSIYKAADEGDIDTWGKLYLDDAAEEIRKGPSRGVTGAEALAAQVERFADPDIPLTAEALHKFRRGLTAKMRSPSDLEAMGFGKESRKLVQPIFKTIVDRIDEALVAATQRGGANPDLWTPALATFTAKSRPLAKARTAELIRTGKDDVTGMMGPTAKTESLSGQPEMTTGVLDKALKLERQQRWKPNEPSLPQQSVDDLAQLQQVAQRGEQVRKAAAATPKESVVDAQSLMRAVRDISGNMFRGGLRAAYAVLNMSDAKALTSMLQNPVEAMAAIRAAEQSAKPLTEAQQLFFSLISKALVNKSTGGD